MGVEETVASGEGIGLTANFMVARDKLKVAFTVVVLMETKRIVKAKARTAPKKIIFLIIWRNQLYILRQLPCQDEENPKPLNDKINKFTRNKDNFFNSLSF